MDVGIGFGMLFGKKPEPAKLFVFSKDLGLVPWEAFTVVTAQALTSTGTQTTTVEAPANCFVLNVDQSLFDAAPEFDPDAFPELGEDAGDWDAEFDSYWQEPISTSATINTTATKTIA